MYACLLAHSTTHALYMANDFLKSCMYVCTLTLTCIYMTNCEVCLLYRKVGMHNWLQYLQGCRICKMQS